MSSPRFITAGLGVVLSGILFVSAASVYGVTYGAGAGPHPQHNNPPPPPQSPRAAAQPKQPTSKPLSPAEKAELDLDNVEKSLREAFEISTEFTQAQTELRAASTAYDTACKSAISSIKEKPEFVAAVNQLKDIEDQLREAHVEGAPQDKISALAMQAMAARKTVHQAETTTYAADPTVVDAKAKLTAAQEKVIGLRKVFQDSMKNDPTWIAAKKVLDDATAANNPPAASPAAAPAAAPAAQ